MSEPAIGFFIVMLFAVPLVFVAIWCLCMLVPAVIEAVAETIANIKIAVQKLKKAWRG
jgi:hypothetical protein